MFGFFSCGELKNLTDNESTDDSDIEEEVLYDPDTGFLWSKRSPDISFELDSETYCENLTEGGYDDWEVPTIEQLETLLENVPEDKTGVCSYAIDGRYSKLGDRGIFCSSSMGAESPCNNVLPVVKSPSETPAPMVMNFDFGIISTDIQKHCYTRCIKTTGNEGTELKKKENNSNNSEIVTDGIYKWSKRSINSMMLKDAHAYCENLEDGGFTDWRLPDIFELRTAIKDCPGVETDGKCPVTDHYYYKSTVDCRGCTYSIDGKYSEFGEGGRFWSSTVDTSIDYGAVIAMDKILSIDFDKGKLIESYTTVGCAYVRCVRNDIGDKREDQPCMDLPGSGEWNSVDRITQTWDGNSWVPSRLSVFNEESSNKECRFKCKDGYVGSNSTCVKAELDGSWSKRAVDRMNWNDAVKYCEDLEENGKSDWRLPLVSEIRTLIQNCPDNEVGGKCGLTDHFDKKYSTQSCSLCGLVEENEYSELWENGVFWTSKLNSQNNALRWTLDLYLGTFRVLTTDSLLSVRCVRADTGQARSGQKCEGLVNNGNWNTVDTITQTWNGSQWGPLTLATYNEDSTQKECRYICAEGYSIIDSSCVNNDLSESWSTLSNKKMNLVSAQKYCENLEEKGSNSWDLPSVSELRTLIINCEKTETAGSCGVTDNCLSGGAYFDSECDCYNCTYSWYCDSNDCDCYCGDESTDPFENCPARDDGNYSEFGDVKTLWTVSVRTDKNQDNWIINFSDATIISDLKSSIHNVRCIKRD